MRDGAVGVSNFTDYSQLAVAECVIFCAIEGWGWFAVLESREGCADIWGLDRALEGQAPQ